METVICNGCSHNPKILRDKWVAHNHAAHNDKATYTYYQPFDILPYKVSIEQGFYSKAPDDCTIAVKLSGPADTMIQCDWKWFNPITRQVHMNRYMISLLQDRFTLLDICAQSGILLGEQAKHSKREALKAEHAKL